MEKNLNDLSISIDQYDKEKGTGGHSLLNSSIEIEHGMLRRSTPIQGEHNLKAPHSTATASFYSIGCSDGAAAGDVLVTQVKHRLEETCQSARKGRGQRGGGDGKPSASIFRFPANLKGIMSDRAHLPEVVSIGPYHHGRGDLLDFEENKWYYFDKYISGSGLDRESAIKMYVEYMGNLERKARECYSEMPPVSSHDFILIMIIDSCFVVKLLQRLGVPGHEQGFDENDPIFTNHWLIPILIADLLKLENQIPFSIIEYFWCQKERESVTTAALRAFNRIFQLPWDEELNQRIHEPKHLLDLFHQSLRPPEHQVTETTGFKKVLMYIRRKISKQDNPLPPSTKSLQCVKQLRQSGIKFKSKKGKSFLDIKFQKRVLEIPSITINDWTSTVLLNCLALEETTRVQFTYITSYVLFMKSLLSEPGDVAYLCSEGIITCFSKNDQFINNFFNNLVEKIDFNVRGCYFSRQVMELEAYYRSHWATMKREYFSSPWTFISVFYAILLLLLSVGQFVISILSYINDIDHK